ncbi:hypothetical protein EK599_06260 [Vibrio sp. T187]|uniref:nuclear transport factor 2 family protein n=1 Tax=Vibrio TaxID=662 RepID=UPI0010CA074A|nr:MULTISPECIES: nuclear transport factor 2 family protein [Vibrio]MBW3695289.1 hypothetical protein [Vibrio sp. T187]
MSEKERIIETLEDYARAYCDKDIDALMHVFDSQGHISVIGTGEDELCSGQSAVRALFLRNFSEATATKFEWKWMDVVMADDLALVALTLNIHLICDNQPLLVPLRWSVTLKKTDRWIWLHRHASTAANSQQQGKAYPSSSV